MFIVTVGSRSSRKRGGGPVTLFSVATGQTSATVGEPE